MTSTPKKHAPAFVETKIGEEMIVMHLESGEFFSLKGTASEIWSLIDGEQSTADIVTTLAERHDAPEEAVKEDVEEFIKQLGQAGLLDHWQAS